jgi:hypothetical protein
LFDEAEQDTDDVGLEEDMVAVPIHTRQKKRRVSIPADIPREVPKIRRLRIKMKTLLALLSQYIE